MRVLEGLNQREMLVSADLNGRASEHDEGPVLVGTIAL
jgi:hypothetical protein